MSKISDLAHALHRKTLERRMMWDVQDDRTISLNIGKNTIIVSKFWNSDGLDWFSIQVNNIDGNTVDEETFSFEEDGYESISELMVKAKRNALRADETLDDILEKINKM